MLSRPYAFGCVLRIRTSPEFKSARGVGSCPSQCYFADANRCYEVLLIACVLALCCNLKCGGLWVQYGHYFPDPQYENVQHIICCDQYATYAFDFEFSNSNGFTRCVHIFNSKMRLTYKP
jgi:hypothetical protein